MEYLGTALTRRIDGLDAYAGLQQIGGTLTATSGTTATFLGVPARYGHLLVEVLGVGHDGGASQTLRIELSGDNGTTWTPATGLFGAAQTAGATLYGSFLIPGYRRGCGSISPSFGNLAADHTVGNIGGSTTSWRIAAGINALRFSWSGGGNFDATGAGQLKLHGF